jgi:hypothetical protein
MHTALNVFPPLPPQDYPEREAAYWSRVSQLIHSRCWKRCERLIRRAPAKSGERAVTVLIQGLLQTASFAALWEAEPTCRRIDDRAALADLKEIQVVPVVELLVAATLDPRGDHRMIDLGATSLYEAACQLEIPDSSPLAARVRALRQLLKGLRPGERETSTGGLYGMTLHGRDMANAVPTELADPQLFVAKYAHDQVLYWRRTLPCEQEPFVRFTIRLDSAPATSTAYPAGGRAASEFGRCGGAAWSKALALWVVDDLVRNVALASRGVRYKFELMLPDEHPDRPPVTFDFWLHENLADVLADLEEGQPFLMHVPNLRRFFLRALVDGPSALTQSHPASRAPAVDLAPYLGALRSTRDSAEEEQAGEPIFSFEVTVSAQDSITHGDGANGNGRPARGAALHLTEEKCWLVEDVRLLPWLGVCAAGPSENRSNGSPNGNGKSHASGTSSGRRHLPGVSDTSKLGEASNGRFAAAEYEVEEMAELRRRLLGRIVDEMLTALSDA